MVSISMAKAGVERQLNTLLNHYDPQLFEITLLLYLNKIEFKIPPSVKVICLNKKGKYDLRFHYKLWKTIASGGYDVINSKIHGLNEYIMFICGVFRRKNLILDIRSSGEYMQKYYRRMRFLNQFFKQKWTIICNSNAGLTEVRECMGSTTKFEMIQISNGIDTERFLPSPQKQQVFTIGYVGRIDRIKNLHTLMAAIKELKKHRELYYKLHIIGKTDDQLYLQELKKYVSENDLQSHIDFFESANDIEKYYNQFDLFVLPSITEGMPNVLLEAMSCGCVCIVSKGANKDRILSVDFEFETNDEIALSDKIKQVYQLSADKRDKIGSENREKVVQNYSVAKMVNNWQTVLLQF